MPMTLHSLITKLNESQLISVYNEHCVLLYRGKVQDISKKLTSNSTVIRKANEKNLAVIVRYKNY